MWRNHERGNGDVRTGQCFGTHQKIGLKFHGGRPKHFTRSAKSCDHLVTHQQDLVLLQKPLQFFVISRGRHDDAPCSHDRLYKKCSNGVGALGQNALLNVSNEPIRKCLFCFSGLPVFGEVRRGEMNKAWQR